MKGMQGLLVAGFLAILGSVLNWLYLQSKAKNLEMVEFVGVRDNVTIEAGQVLKNSDLISVKIPAKNAGQLQDFVFLYRDIKTVVGIRATRAYTGGEFVYRSDYRTPPSSLNLKPNERLIPVPVNSRTFIPEFVDPGDQVTFIVPKAGVRTSPGRSTKQATPARSTQFDLIGPFTVGSIGNRLGSNRVSRANRGTQSNQRVIGVVVETDGSDQLKGKINTLLNRIQSSNGQDIRVMYHKREENKRR